MGRSSVSGHPLARLELPWWLSVILAAAAYVLLRWIIPSLAGASVAFKPLVAAAQSAAAVVAVLFLAFAAYSLALAYRRRRALDLETSLAMLRALPRERFEHLLAAVFRSEGYAIREPADRDCGIDCVLVRGDEKLLVQYRHWRNATMGAATLHELCDRLQAESATGCVFVTTGDYTHEAARFASGSPVRLIAGRQLERMLRAMEPSGPAW